MDATAPTAPVRSPLASGTGSTSTSSAIADGAPVEALRPKLGGRIVNALRRADLETVEQVATATDEQLLAIDRFARPSVDAIRDAIAAAQCAPYDVDDALTLSAEQATELVALVSVLISYADARGQREISARARGFLKAVVPAR